MTIDVTVAIPTHNRPELMKAAVESVLAQDADVTGEIVVVFDACPVELPDVELPDNWTLRGVPNERTRGLAGARNTGILAAAGEYVAFLDDDDLWLPEKLSAQLVRFAAAPDAVLVGTAMVVDDGQAEHVRLVPVREPLPRRLPTQPQPGPALVKPHVPAGDAARTAGHGG